MKVYIVTGSHITGRRYLANVGNKLHSVGTKDRAIAEKIASKVNGQIYSLLLDDGIRLVSGNTDNLIACEARKIGAI